MTVVRRLQLLCAVLAVTLCATSRAGDPELRRLMRPSPRPSPRRKPGPRPAVRPKPVPPAMPPTPMPTPTPIPSPPVRPSAVAPVPPRPKHVNIRGSWTYSTRADHGTLEVREQDAEGNFRGVFRSLASGTVTGKVTGNAFRLEWKYQMIFTVRGHASGTISADARGGLHMVGEADDMSGKRPFSADRLD